MSVNHSTPEESRSIADHTMHAISGLRRCTTAADLKSQANSWFAWAKTNGVCAAIKDHMHQVEIEMASRVKRNEQPPRDIRNPAGADQ